MKKVSFLLMSVLFAFAANAQSVVEKFNSSLKGESATINTISPQNTTPISYLANKSGTLAAAGDTIAYYDFNSSAGLSLTGNTTRGWSIGTGNSWWSTQGIVSTSGADWAVLKPGDPRQGALSAATYTMTTSAINCTGKNSVVLSFEQYYARFEDTASVQISTDGTTFTTIYDNMDLLITSTAGSNPTSNPMKVTVNISQLAANKANVYVRFSWKSRTQTQPGIGYGWWIDDLMLFEGESNDLSIVDSYWKPYTDSTFIHYADFYTQIPNRQARQYPIQFSAKYSNLGGATQTNAGFKAMVTGPSAFSQTETATKSSLSPLATDSTSTTKAITLTSGVGVYNVDLIVTADSALKLNDDDTLGATVEVTNGTYARDNNDIVGAGAFYYNPSAIWEWEVGAIFELKTLDNIVGVEWLNTAANTRRAGKTGTVTVNIYNVGDYTSNSISGVANAPIFSSSSVNMSALKDSVDKWVKTPLSRVVGGTDDTLGPGNYLVTLRGDQNFGSDTIFWPVQRTDFVNSQYLVRVAQSGGAMGNWTFGGRKYMIRLITKPTACPTLVGGVATGTPTTACGNIDGEVEVTSDPSNGLSPYTYAWDINGTITAGKKVSGLGSGSYQVTITDGNGCTVVSSAGVSDFGAPTVTQDATNSTTTTTCFGDRQGKISIIVVKGANPNPNYTFKWVEASAPTTTISTDSTIINIEAGTYRVEVNDGSNPPCIQSINVVVSGPSEGIKAASGSVVNNECVGDVKGEVEMVLTGGTGSLTIAWAGGSNATKRTSLAAGSYAYTVTDDNNCTLTASHNVTQPSTPFSITTPAYGAATGISSITPVSSNNSVELEVKTSGGITSTIASSKGVEWRNPAGNIILGQELALLIIDPTKANRDGYGDYIAVAKNTVGCKSAAAVFTVLQEEYLFPFSIAEFGVNSSLSIFPNPSKGMVNIKLDNSTSGDYTISVKNVVGQVMYTETLTVNGSLNKVLDLESADAGVYFINISNGTSEVSKKIIIE
jgi:hypothetical protein